MNYWTILHLFDLKSLIVNNFLCNNVIHKFFEEFDL